jgi:hypothetical protein
MSRGISKSSPPSTHITNILQDLFQNEISHNDDETRHVVFSRAQLSDHQKQNLITPDGYESLNIFIVYQTDVFINDKLSRTFIQLVSFLKKDKYIYGYYYNISDQSRYDDCVLINSKRPIKIDDTAKIIYSEYIEMYNDIKGTSVILGFSSNPPYASLQYSHKCKYYYETLDASGSSIVPESKLTGLSRNICSCH